MKRTVGTRFHSSLRQHLLALLAGFACTFPVQADVLLPSTPLQASSIVPPNITFVLDDSGSMFWRYLYGHQLPGDHIAGGGIDSSASGDDTSQDNLTSYSDPVTADHDSNDMYDQTYVTNTLYYNPNFDYLPWTNADKTLFTNTPYNAVYTNHNNVTGSTINLFNNVQTYYIPKVGFTGDNNALNYNRYQILTDGTIYRSELLQASDVITANNLLNATKVTASKNNFITSGGTPFVSNFSFTVPAGVSILTVTTSGGSGNSDLYVRQGSKPNGSTNVRPTLYDCRSISGNNTDTCTIASPAAGTWWVGLYAGSTFSNLTLSAVTDVITGTTGVGCNDTTAAGYDWRNCTEITPTGRTEAQERQNFATWFSFYQTRIKTAKGAATAAFSNLGFIPRVGYRTIHDNNNIDIPVTLDQGLFEDKAAVVGPPAVAAVSNRTNWYTHLLAATAGSGTPLRTALTSMGQYYSQTSATGPYGPEATGSQISCRQNFTILTTDGYWNESFSITDQDNTAGATITGPTPDNLGTQSYTYAPVLPYKAAQANTLADVAMKYWKTDLRTDTGMTNNVPTAQSDPAFWQHMATFTVSIGHNGTLTPSPATLAQITAGTLSWPTAVGDTITTIDDLWHAAVNGHGAFVVASDPNEFANALRAALAAIAERTSSSSNVAANSTRLDTGTTLFQAIFTTGLWTGDLIAYPVSASGVGITPTWRASQHVPIWTSRNIFTWDTGTASGANFPTAAETTALGGTAGSDYAAGDHSNEVAQGGSFRDRSVTVLGDIDHSSPFFVAGDNTVTPHIPPMVYVGGNDGMLHGFNATDGTEVLAYVPGGVNFANMKTMQNPDYLHQYLVDGEVTVSTKAQTVTATYPNGRNILVGTLGRGGKTVYALDVTDPVNFDTPQVLWEYTDADMGNVLGKPIITKLNNGKTGVILGNGYNSTTGRAFLYVLNVETGALIKKIDTVAGDTTTNSNGMTTPKGWDSDRNGTVDLIYAGDLLGNMWRFDLSNANPTNWGSSFTSAGNPQPLYAAKDASGNAQPITGGLSIGLDPSTFKRWLFFGTGRYLTTGDPANLSVQSWYGLIDAGANITSVTTRNSTVLKQRKIVVATTSNGKTVRAFEQPTNGDMTGLKGWYVDWQDETTSPATPQGERVITDDILLGSVLLVATIIPAVESCAVGGRGFINAINPFTGGAVTSPFFDINSDGNFNGSDKVTDSGGHAISIGSVDLGVAMPTMPAFIQKLVVAGGSSGNVGSIQVSNPTNSGRISWREILIGN